MLEPGSPHDDERKQLHSNVPPLTSSIYTSHSPSPDISCFDGTPLDLLPALFLSSPLASTLSSHDMARKVSISRNDDAGDRKGRIRDLKRCQAPHHPGKPLQNGHAILPDRSPKETPVITSDTVPSFSHLAGLLRSEKYQTTRCRQAQHHLHRAQVLAARTARLARLARSAQRTLAESIKSEDKTSFANLFNAFQDVLSGCIHVHSGEPQDEDERQPAYPTSFVDALPQDSQEPLLDFLAKVRTDPVFVADRLASLSHKDLLALVPQKSPSRSDESVFDSPEKSSSRASKNLGYVVDGQIELFSSYEFASPLETLIQSVRPLPLDDLRNDPVAMNVWATACARLITEQKHGSDKLAPAIIDIWASASAWPGKNRLELWLLETLQKGSFLLEHPHTQSFQIRVQERRELTPAEAQRQQDFFDQAVTGLFHELADGDVPSLIPSGAKSLCQAIVRRLEGSPRHQRAFPNFVVMRWLFPLFLSDAVSSPESHGLLTDHFVSEAARQRILREVVRRAYKAASEVIYAWKLGNAPSEGITTLVQAIADQLITPSKETSSAASSPTKTESENCIVAITAADVQTMVYALYPPPAANSFINRNGSHSSLRSSASSLSGFSLFQTASSPGAPPIGNLSGSNNDQSGASTKTLSVDQYASSDSLSDVVAAGRQAEMDGGQLRVICDGIDEVLSGQRGVYSDHWCFVITGHAGDCLLTVQCHFDRKLADIAVQTSRTRRARQLVEDLLEQNELRPITPSHTGSRASLDGAIEANIQRALKKRAADCEQASEFVQAHSYFRKAQHLREMLAEGGYDYPFISLLDQIQLDKKNSLEIVSSALDICDSMFRSIATCLDQTSNSLSGRMHTLTQLRDKMWYVADVRTSAPYDDARAISAALKTMGRPHKAARTRLAPVAQVKGSANSFHLKSEMQVLDLMTAPPGRGGRGKLSDDQSKSLAVWMERNGVENLCRGEERLHRFCMEIRKVVAQVAAESSPLIAGELFTKDRLASAPRTNAAHQVASFVPGNGGRFNLLNLRTYLQPGVDAASTASSYALSTTSSRGQLDGSSPSVSNRSSAPFWSPVPTEARSPSSISSVQSANARGTTTPMPPGKSRHSSPEDGRNSYVEDLRQRLTSLLISDLGSGLFANGSETDVAFWTGFGGEVAERYLDGLRPGDFQQKQQRGTSSTSLEDFDFENAFEKLVRQFSTISSPHAKLAVLMNLDILLWQARTTTTTSFSKHGTDKPASAAVTDLKVEGFRQLFSKKTTRPPAIFRDLQYIAALIPLKTLEETAPGRAFWNAAVALSSLKQEFCNVMIETADGIIAHHSNTRSGSTSATRTSSRAQAQRDSAAFASLPIRTPSPEDISGRSLADAGHLLQTVAKEGHAVAQRELATLYLTDPELMPHILAPLARPRDVFREELESKWRRDRDPTRCDPTTMCVAHHWMSLSSRGGDALAMEFLRQREEMERLP